MKILFCQKVGGAFGYITESMINALRSAHHIVERWDGQEKSWYDFQPHLYCGCSGHKQPMPPVGSKTRGKCKIAIHVNPYGPTSIKGINESLPNIEWTLNQHPDVVFGYGHDDDGELWNHWTKKHSIPWVPLPTAGDRTIFRTLSIKRDVDLVYLGGRWSYKSTTIDAYLLPLLTKSTLTHRVHGWGEWPDGVCSGVLPDEHVCEFFNSGKVGPCISEPHTHSHGIDIPERAFKVALCGALVVHDPAWSVRRLIPSAVIAKNSSEFQDMCRYYCDPRNESERMVLADKQRKQVLSTQTYHHRMGRLLTVLGFNDAATAMVSQK